MGEIKELINHQVSIIFITKIAYSIKRVEFNTQPYCLKCCYDLIIKKKTFVKKSVKLKLILKYMVEIKTYTFGQMITD